MPRPHGTSRNTSSTVRGTSWLAAKWSTCRPGSLRWIVPESAPSPRIAFASAWSSFAWGSSIVYSLGRRPRGPRGPGLLSAAGGRLLQPHPPQQIGESRVRAERIEPRMHPEPDQAAVALAEGALQPLDRPLLLSQGDQDRRDRVRGHVAAGPQRLQVLEDAERVLSPSLHRVGVCQPRRGFGIAPAQ